MGVKCGVDIPLDVDEQPAGKLHFMYELLLPLHNDHVCRESLNGNNEGSAAGGRGQELHEVAIVGNLSSSLSQLKYRDYSFSHHCYVRHFGPSGFGLVSKFSRNMAGPRARYNTAALSSLDFLSHENPGTRTKIHRSDIIMWSALTHLPALRTFKSKSILRSSAIEWLTTEVILGSLKTLDIVVHLKCNSQRSDILIGFLCSLPPLDNLALTGKIRPTRCNRWIPFHAPSLKRLQLITIKHRDSTFDLVSLGAMMQPPLPLLEHLRITVQRSKGNSDEVGMYKILGAMPRLQSIVLELDSSISSRHTDFWTQNHKLDSERDQQLTDPYIMDALVNSAIDEKLAIAIFRAISSAKPDRSLPLERLEIRPSGDHPYGWTFKDFGTDLPAVMKHIERSCLVKRRYPGLGSDVLTVNQVRNDRAGRKIYLPKRLKEPTESIYRRVWPMRPGTKGDWKNDWHSFPLQLEEVPNQHDTIMRPLLPCSIL